MFMTWAGHETTTAQTTWLLTDLLLHPEWFERVRAEVDAVLGDSPVREISWAQLGALKTLDMVIRESERLHPIAPMLQRVAKEDIEIAGYRIPKGDRVVVAPRLSQLDPREFPDPEIFRPERFDPNGECPANMDSLIGFGGGLHRCLGVNFARLEMKSIVAALVQRYDMELVDEVRRVKGMQSPWPQSPCRMEYRLRDAIGGGAKPTAGLAIAPEASAKPATGCPVAH
jgi:sterol 14-demethylase